MVGIKDIIKGQESLRPGSGADAAKINLSFPIFKIQLLQNLLF